MATLLIGLVGAATAGVAPSVRRLPRAADGRGRYDLEHRPHGPRRRDAVSGSRAADDRPARNRQSRLRPPASGPRVVSSVARGRLGRPLGRQRPRRRQEGEDRDAPRHPGSDECGRRRGAAGRSPARGGSLESRLCGRGPGRAHGRRRERPLWRVRRRWACDRRRRGIPDRGRRGSGRRVRNRAARPSPPRRRQRDDHDRRTVRRADGARLRRRRESLRLGDHGPDPPRRRGNRRRFHVCRLGSRRVRRRRRAGDGRASGPTPRPRRRSRRQPVRLRRGQPPHSPRGSPHGRDHDGCDGSLVPVDAAVAPDGSLYVADFGGNRVARITNGTVTTVATAVGPNSIAVDAGGSLYFTERTRPRVLRFDQATRRVSVVLGR